MTFLVGLLIGSALTTAGLYALSEWAVRELIRRGRLQGSIDGRVFG